LFNIVSEFLTVFLLFELLPVPINLNILLVTDQDLVFELGGTLSALLFFKTSASVLQVIVVKSHLGDQLVSLSADLLEDTLSFVNLDITISGHFFSACNRLRTNNF
jgi:hypothetical protein